MNDDLLRGYVASGPDLISDDEIDYASIAMNTQPHKPGGRIVFSTADYATEEDAMAEMEKLFMGDMEEDEYEFATEA